ncbi:MAG: hypothetical protein C0592_03245 [Marinilabiliales bacterium]|nr:MAG: hypothetical protein C0592_03245 [Marinilabiliales bacterium]
MRKAFVLLLFLAANSLFAQDTLVSWYDEIFTGKILNVKSNIVSIILDEDSTRTQRIHTSELQKAIYGNGEVIYFFDEYPDIVTKLKKSSKRKKKISFTPISAPFNHIYFGYEHMIGKSKNRTLEYQAGYLGKMLMPIDKNAWGLHSNFLFKSIFSEPMRISGMSVRPLMQGAFYGCMVSFNFIHFEDDIVYRSDTSYFTTYTLNKKINAIIPTVHFIFGYHQLIAPAIMITYSAGLGGGPVIYLSSDERLKNQAEFPDIAMGSQRFISLPVSLNAQITLGILLR